jgi:hypothetical protein
MSESHTFHTEPDKISPRPVLAILSGWLAFVAISIIGLYLYYGDFVGHRKLLKPQPAAAPQLQTTPRSDLQSLQTSQEKRLQGYSWVDKGKGIVHVPIGRAMEIVASEGSKAFDAMDTGPLTPADINASMPGQAMEIQGLSPPGAQK